MKIAQRFFQRTNAGAHTPLFSIFSWLKLYISDQHRVIYPGMAQEHAPTFSTLLAHARELPQLDPLALSASNAHDAVIS